MINLSILKILTVHFQNGYPDGFLHFLHVLYIYNILSFGKLNRCMDKQSYRQKNRKQLQIYFTLELDMKAPLKKECLALFCSIWFLSALSVPDDQCMSFKNIKCENECRTCPFLLRTVTLAGLKWIDTHQHGSGCCSVPSSLSSIFRSSPSIHHCQILRLTPSAHVMAAYKAWTCLKVCECAHAPTHMCPCDDVFGAEPWSRTWQKSSCCSCVQFVLWLNPVRQQFTERSQLLIHHQIYTSQHKCADFSLTKGLFHTLAPRGGCSTLKFDLKHEKYIIQRLIVLFSPKRTNTSDILH